MDYLLWRSRVHVPACQWWLEKSAAVSSHTSKERDVI